MIGPSSSHTAGAARIGRVARQLLKEPPAQALITLYGSFAQTFRGHGTDRAIIGGLLGFEPSDARLRDSFEHAARCGLAFRFQPGALSEGMHPNTARVELRSVHGEAVEMLACSVGGGAISVKEVNGVEVSFSAQYFTTVILNEDKPGVVADVAKTLAANDVNIAFMKLFRKEEDRRAIMVIETDQLLWDEIGRELQSVKHVEKVLMIQPLTE